MDALSTTAQADDSSGANPSSIKSDDSSPQRGSGAGSPPPNCAICLGTCKNKSFTDSCLHQFCFSCLLTWSKVKAECPLCKQAFRSIIHNVQSNHQYEEYLVVQRQNEESSSRIDIDRITAATHRFRYSTTLTLPRRETIAIQDLLRHYPFMANVFPAVQQRPCPARRRLSPASFRRTVYRHNLWARLLPDFTGRFRDCTPEFYRYNNTQMHRLVPWLNRELHYLLNENVGHISYVLSRILDMLPQYHINSSEFREAMQRYFGERTEHFLHELYCYASTPYDMAGYDRNVQYTTGIPTVINEVISSSDSEASGDSDIVMVSSSMEADPPPGPSRVPAPVYPDNYISQPSTANNVIPIETISHSDTDDDSSEVMVVGYIKPPQDRTPEIVDLLGSDSDVIVQDVQPEPSHNSVKVTLKRHRTHNNVSQKRPRTNSDSSYVPSSPKMRRCDLSDDSDSGSDWSRNTPKQRYRTSIPHPAYPSASTTSSSSSSSDDSSVRSASVRTKSKKKSTRDRKRSGKHSRSHKIDVKDIPLPEPDTVHSRKSHTGKGVKSSNKNLKNSMPPDKAVPSERNVSPSEPVASDINEPGTSGTQRRKHNKEHKRRRRGSRESRRLKSVVNVMYNNSPRHESNSNENCNSSSSTSNVAINTPVDDDNDEEAAVNERPGKAGPSSSQYSPANVRQFDSTTDSEDNLPLNLTLQKLNPTTSD